MKNDPITIKLKKKGIGVFPDYNITIYGSGKVIYEGIENVKVEGKKQKNINKKEIIDLLKDFKNSGFFLLKDEYLSEGKKVSSSTILSIKIRDKNNNVKYKNIKYSYDNKNIPKALIDLEGKINNIVDSKRWLGNPSKTPIKNKKTYDKKIESIVRKHETSSKIKKVYRSNKFPFIVFVILVSLILILGFFSGIFTNIFENSSDKNKKISNNIISYSKNSGYVPLVVSFNCSNSYSKDSNYLWDFGDGESSSLKNPVHVFKNVGNYNVSLSLNNKKDDVSKVEIIVLDRALVQTLDVDFDISPGIKSGYIAGNIPLDLSILVTIENGQGPFDYFWDFGDGNISYYKNVNYTFNKRGFYTVNFYVSDLNGYSFTDSFEIVCS